MNTKRSSISIVITLVVLLANVLTVFAREADPPEVAPTRSIASTCVRTAYASVDIPASRVDYMILGGSSLCPVVAATSIKLIPNTGSRQTGYADPNFMAFKERQIQSMMP